MKIKEGDTVEVYVGGRTWSKNYTKIVKVRCVSPDRMYFHTDMAKHLCSNIVRVL